MPNPANFTTELPLSPNFVPKGDTYWWVTFQNTVSLDLMEIAVSVQNPKTNIFPIDNFITYIQDHITGLSLGGDPNHQGILGRVPILGPSPFNEAPPSIALPDILGAIQDTGLLPPIGFTFLENVSLFDNKGNFQRDKLQAVLLEMQTNGLLAQGNNALGRPDATTFIMQAVDKVVGDNFTQQLQFQINNANNTVESTTAKLQALDNFNTFFGTNFSLDNNQALFNGGNNPSNAQPNNPGMPIQIFRFIDAIEINPIDSHDGIHGSIDLTTANLNNGDNYYTDKIFSLITITE